MTAIAAPLSFGATPLSQSIAARAEGKSGGIKNLMEGRTDLYQVNPVHINIENGFNVRDFESERMKERIDELAQSIATVGLKRALKVRMKNNKLILVDGECRLRAVRRAIDVYGAHILKVKVEMVERGFSDADAVLSIAVENDALALTVLEKGAVFKRLEAFGWSINDIAKSVGLTPTRIAQMIELTAVPEPVKEMIRAGTIAPSLAGQIAKKHDFDTDRTVAAVEAAQKVATEEGKSKITPRSVARSTGTAKESKKSAAPTGLIDDLTTIFKAAHICEDAEEDGREIVVITFSRDEAEKIEMLLNTKLF